MEVVVVGGKGMLGTDLVAELESRGHDVTSLDLPQIDITNPESCAELAVGTYGKPDWCINCAAYTAVDKAESERDLAIAVNGLGPSYLAQSCGMANIRVLHVSTDFVFDGVANEPYTEEQEPNPTGAYAESKRMGELAVLNSGPGNVIARTAWLYGPNGPSFPRTMIRAWKAGKTLRVVSDQVGSPTYTGDLARVLAEMVEKNAQAGIYHTAGSEPMSWHDLAKKAIGAYQVEVVNQEPAVEIEPLRTEDWPTPARRPAYSVLSFEKARKLGIEPMRSTDEALKEFVKRLPEEL